jgi:hypothetical protein
MAVATQSFRFTVEFSHLGAEPQANDEAWAILGNLRAEGMAMSDGPRLIPAHDPKSLASAITPDVPFCAAAKAAAPVVLALRSVPPPRSGCA